MWEILRPVILVLLWDMLFLVLCGIPVVLLAMFKRPAFAVLKRNFIGYFMNPTGYAFLVLFVFLCSLAQFWPYAFFNANMATLDQLSSWFPLVMLTFIPAITMSIWADERRQGTDELLLTIPANDFDIVIGKYLSTAAIFTVSLLFSQVTILFLLDLLSQGGMDYGLFLSTYLGYWLAGLGMLALGMVGSFLTSNITIGFMLAALINVPLVAAYWADSIVPTSRLAQFLSRMSISGQLRDFERGVVSLSSTSYFVMLIVLGLFLSMVLIGRRHWMGGRRGALLSLHFTARALCLVAILVGVNLVFAHYDVRSDLTRGQVNRLHPDTLTLIDDLNPRYTIVIDAYISDNIPEMFAPTARDLETLLRELDVRGGDNIEVHLHKNISIYSEEAVRASERYGIEPQTVATLVRGAVQEEEIILAAAVTMGLDQQVIEFFSNGIPVEYELIRTIVTLAGPSQKSIEELAAQLEPRDPVVIEAYLSTGIPDEFDDTSGALVRALEKIETEGNGAFEVHIHQDFALDSAEAREASSQFGIEPRTITTESSGEQTFILSAAFALGSKEQVIPFFTQDADVIDEVSRTLLSLVGDSKKTLGIVTTDAKLMGGISMSTFSQVPPQLIVSELMKQYEVVAVDPTMPIEDMFDVLLVAQPSSLTDPQIANLVDAVRRGIPTAIFEDPFPYPGIWTEVPGTQEPRSDGGMMGGMQMRQEPKGDLYPLWDLLGVELVTAEYGRSRRYPIIWQRYNPYPQIRGYDQISDEWVFVDNEMPNAGETFNQDSAVSSGLEEVLMIFPGAISHRELSSLQYTPLVRTSKATGTVFPEGRRVETNRPYDLAVHITGRDPEEDERVDALIDSLNAGGGGSVSDDSAQTVGAPGGPAERPVNVILVSDLDVLASFFLEMRSRPNPQLPFRFDNVTFVLNVIDELAGDNRFMEIRKHKRTYPTLRHIEERIREAEEEGMGKRLEFERLVEEMQSKAERAVTEAGVDIVMEQIETIQAQLDRRQEELASSTIEASEEELENLQELQEELVNFQNLQEAFTGMVEGFPEGQPSSQQEAMQLQQLAGGMQQSLLKLTRLAIRSGLLSQEDLLIAQQRAEMEIENTVRVLQAEVNEVQRDTQRQIRQIETNSQMDIQRIQNSYKIAAVVYPILLPMAIGLFVFFFRRRRENEGTVSERMR